MGGPRQSNHISRHRHVSPDEMNHIVIPDTQKVYRCHALLCWTSEVLSKTKISLKVGNITDLPR